MNPLKKGFRTLGFTIVLAVLGVLDGFVWTGIIPEVVQPFVLPMVAGIVLWLRTITTTAMGESE